jgi:hypothetical protein
VHAAVLSTASLVGACVIPPTITVTDTDAGVNSPPTILSVRDDSGEFPTASPVIASPFDVGPTAGNLTIEAMDTDLDDTLYVRVFVDYGRPDVENARATCVAVPGDTPQTRVATCDLRALCKSTDVGAPDALYMTVVVFDRPVLDSGDPAFQAMEPGGLSATRGYFITCKNPDPT